MKRFNGWLLLAVAGIIEILVQFNMPDLVPNIVITMRSTAPPLLDMVLEVFLILWVYGGYIALISGIVGWLVSISS
jgi:hypothetical protein